MDLLTKATPQAETKSTQVPTSAPLARRTSLEEGLAHEDDGEGGGVVTLSPNECTTGPKGQ